MADTPNDEAQPSASDPNAAHEAATRPTVKKKATKKATAKKKTASKKVAAKAGAAKKKVTKKKVPMTENVTPPLVSDTSTPQCISAVGADTSARRTHSGSRQQGRGRLACQRAAKRHHTERYNGGIGG